MKGKKIVLLAVAAATVASCVAFSACGSAKSEGLYAKYNAHNHTDMTNPVSDTYKLEVFSDGTYILNYESLWALPVVTLVYGRDLTSYGTYTVDESNTEEGAVVYILEMPTRMSLIHMDRSATSLVVDTDRWPEGDPVEGTPAGITYTLNARAETETWETADAFIAAYGRTYKMTCDTTTGAITDIEITNHNGEQIPGDGAVKADA